MERIAPRKERCNVTTIVQKSERKISASDPVASQISTLNHLIANPPTNSRVIEYSPKLAQWVLENLNHGNRSKKPGQIERYASDIKGSRWGVTGDTIKFGTDGLLKDGQNRLSACIRANAPFTSHTVFGIDASLFHRMDIGKKRDGGDVFAIAGIKNATQMAGAMRWHMILSGPRPADRGQVPTNEELLNHYRTNFDSSDSSRKLAEHAIQAAQGLYRMYGHPISVTAALYIVFSKKDAARATQFFDDWVSGKAGTTKTLQRYLTKLSERNAGRLHETLRNGVIINAWNAYRRGERIAEGALKHSETDRLPAY